MNEEGKDIYGRMEKGRENRVAEHRERERDRQSQMNSNIHSGTHKIKDNQRKRNRQTYRQTDRGRERSGGDRCMELVKVRKKYKETWRGNRTSEEKVELERKREREREEREVKGVLENKHLEH